LLDRLTPLLSPPELQTMTLSAPLLQFAWNHSLLERQRCLQAFAGHPARMPGAVPRLETLWRCIGPAAGRRSERRLRQQEPVSTQVVTPVSIQHGKPASTNLFARNLNKTPCVLPGALLKTTSSNTIGPPRPAALRPAWLKPRAVA